MLHYNDTQKQMMDQGRFKIVLHNPGFNIKSYDDHGYGPLAVIAESFMAPDTWIGMHPHTNDEIISWVPDGVMRHDDRTNGPLITDKDHLMVMNAGKEFWHEERTLAGDPPLRMLQIFVRPHTTDLEPVIQHGKLAAWEYGTWRKIFGQEHSGSDFYVRNDVEMYDLRVKADGEVTFPTREGYAVYFMTFDGSITVHDRTFSRAETGLLIDEKTTSLVAVEDSLVVAFLVNPKAKISKTGSHGR